MSDAASTKNRALSLFTATTAVSALAAVAMFVILVHEVFASLNGREGWISWSAAGALHRAFFLAVLVAALSGGGTLVAMKRWRGGHDRGDGTALVAVGGVVLAALVVMFLAPWTH